MDVLSKLTLLYKCHNKDICNSLMPYLAMLFGVIHKTDSLNEALKISQEK